MKNKKTLIIISIIILISLIIAITIVNKKNTPKKTYHIELNDNLTVEINTETTAKSYIKDIKNAKIVKDNKIDTTTLGEKETSVLISTNGKEESYKFKIQVIDTLPPEINGIEDINIKVGTKIDLLKNITVTDNSKEEIKIEVKGEYDITKKGKYKLSYIASDSSGNIKEEEFTLTIDEQPIKKEAEQKTNNESQKVVNIKTINGIIICNKTYAVPENFIPTNLVSCGNSKVKKSICEEFNKMKNAAANDGVNIYLQSGYRSYATQKGLYEGYLKQGRDADTFSARPGHSEHHTGEAMDICSNQTSNACINSNFNNTEASKWLANNAHKYGFILRYPSGKESITGYNYESWHYRYVGTEIAEKLYNGGNWLTLEEYFNIDSSYKENYKK